MVAFVSVGDKDTITNVTETGEFTVSIVERDMVERMNVSSASAPRGTSEFPVSGVTPIAGDDVAAPFVAESRVAIECRLQETVRLGDDPSYIVIGEALRFHVARELIGENGRIEVDALDQVARMGGITYSDTTSRFSLQRPAWEDVAAGAEPAPASSQAPTNR